MRWRFFAAALLLAGCATAPDQSSPQVESARDYIREVTGDDLKASGLFVTVRSATIDGRKVRISTTVVNRYDQQVEGVRFIVQFAAAGDAPRIVDTIYQESEDTNLDPGEDRVVRIEIENSVRDSGPGRFAIEAHPMRLGGTDIPPPAGWK